MPLATPKTWKVALVLWFCLFQNRLLPARDLPAGESEGSRTFALAAQKDYLVAQARYRLEPEKVDAAVQFGRACFDRAEFSTSSTERAGLAEQGIAACRQALTRVSNSAAAHYYLGLNQGQLARTKSLGALRLVNQMEREFTTARALDEQFDYAGADRALGLLYRDAPAFASIGNRSKAREHLERALKLAPNFPENRLNLLESALEWGEKESARRELAVLEAALPAARFSLSGPAWAATWADWDNRLRAAKKKLEDPSKKLETPRGKGA